MGRAWVAAAIAAAGAAAGAQVLHRRRIAADPERAELEQVPRGREVQLRSADGTRLHAEIRKRVEAVLTSERKWTREEVARTLADAAHAQTDADLRSMLAAEAAPAAERREELFE